MCDNIPNELKKMRRWVVYEQVVENGRISKVPIDPQTRFHLRWSDNTLWLTFDDALRMSRYSNEYGIGFILGDGIAGIDLDNVVKPDGTLREIAVEVISHMNSYTEYSLSGKGVHIMFYNDSSSNFNNRKPISNIDGTCSNFEIYSGNRFFVVTGNKCMEVSALYERGNAAMELYNKYIAPITSRDEQVIIQLPQKPLNKCYRYPHKNALSNQPDKSIWKKAKNDIMKIDYTDKSKGDWNVILILKRYTNDKEQVERIMREYTGKYREKWDTIRNYCGNCTTYLKYSIDKAFA